MTTIPESKTSTKLTIKSRIFSTASKQMPVKLIPNSNSEKILSLESKKILLVSDKNKRFTAKDPEENKWDIITQTQLLFKANPWAVKGRDLRSRKKLIIFLSQHTPSIIKHTRKISGASTNGSRRAMPIANHIVSCLTDQQTKPKETA